MVDGVVFNTRDEATSPVVIAHYVGRKKAGCLAGLSLTRGHASLAWSLDVLGSHACGCPGPVKKANLRDGRQNTVFCRCNLLAQGLRSQGPDGKEIKYYGKRSGRDDEMLRWWEDHAGS